MQCLCKTIALYSVLIIMATTAAYSEWVPPLERAKAREREEQLEEENPDIPWKWYRGARGYEDALEIQKATQADIFIYFIRPNTPDEKGLCSWLEKKGIRSQPVKELLREYVKVVVPLPANPRNQDLAEKFHVNKTPAVFAVHPDGWRNRITVFHWDEDPLKLLEPEELEKAIRLNSSEKYHPPKEESESE